MSRLHQLLKFLEEEPNDPFNIYALALEYQKIDAEKALTFFELLTKEHADYVATYYHLGKLHEELGNKEQAVQIFETGINKARSANDLKALKELQNALGEIQYS
jgi:tetratricopeptide (TPR) repeat protein